MTEREDDHLNIAANDDGGDIPFTYFRAENIAQIVARALVEAMDDMDVETANGIWKRLGIEPCDILHFELNRNGDNQGSA